MILGIVASIVPNYVFRWLFLRQDARTPRQIVKYFYLCASLKFISFVLLFSVILQWSKLHVVCFFMAFLVSELGRCVYCWFDLPRIITK